MTDQPLRYAATPHPSVLDRLRMELYLTRLEWHLEEVMRGRERRATIRELRHVLKTDPRGTVVGLRDLGSPKLLAEQYGGDRHRRPLWSIGVITAGAVLLAYWTVFLAFTFGMLAVVESSALQEAHATLFSMDVIAFHTTDGFGIGWTSQWAWLVVPAVIALVALLLGARSWRALASGQGPGPS